MKNTTIVVSVICAMALLWAACKGGEPEFLPMLEWQNSSIEEPDNGNASLNFVVSVPEPASQEIRFSYRTEDISAIAGEDYTAASGVATIAAGAQEVSFQVEILGDTYLEFDETFNIVLEDLVNAESKGSRIQGRILNDDLYVPESETDGFSTPAQYPGFELVWQDEFDGASLNTTDWNYELGGGGWGNNELQVYTDLPENVTLKDGKLVITAVENAGDFTSARLTTEGKKEFQFGRIDVRARLPYGQGIWPAIWMLGNNIRTVSWPSCGEIDIMEMVGHEPERVHSTIHYNNNGHNYTGRGYSLAGGEAFHEKFHVFSLLWQDHQLRFLVDYNVVYQVDRVSIPANPYPFSSPFFFICNIAVGGQWPGSPDQTTVFPQTMEIDYIRVFQ